MQEGHDYGTNERGEQVMGTSARHVEIPDKASGVVDQMFMLPAIGATLATSGIGAAGYQAYRWYQAGREAQAARQAEQLAAKNPSPDKIFSTKAPKQVTPGTKELNGQYINDKGRVEPWEAHYDEYGRQIGRTDYNAGNNTQGIPDTHYHTYQYGPGMNGMETGSHIPGVFNP